MSRKHRSLIENNLHTYLSFIAKNSWAWEKWKKIKMFSKNIIWFFYHTRNNVRRRERYAFTRMCVNGACCVVTQFIWISIRNPCVQSINRATNLFVFSLVCSNSPIFSFACMSQFMFGVMPLYQLGIGLLGPAFHVNRACDVDAERILLYNHSADHTHRMFQKPRQNHRDKTREKQINYVIHKKRIKLNVLY